ncbi:MAG: hypothetical protein C0623_09615 [Desulfuromonas sp.]|nr:MAG: hypothetical protein C0623_09615 [Desulfuromonas sp.]
MIIGFAGKAASGKTTAAKHLAPLLTGPFQIIPMAQLLREEVENFLELIGATEYTPLVYGCQDDKVKTFYVDTSRALANCPKWNHFISEHQEIQDRDDRTAITVRRILQWWGTEYRREQDPDYWTSAWANKVKSYDLEKTNILVDDIRFNNELKTLKGLGGLIVKIERPGFAGAGNHASETSLDDYSEWDHIVQNDGTLEQFLDKISDLRTKLP